MRLGGGGGGGWRSVIQAEDERPRLTRELLLRVLRYGRPYRLQIVGMLALILIVSGLNLLNPLIVRDLIDRAIPSRDVNRLIFLASMLLVLPVVRGLISVVQRRLNASVGEGVIFDLRVALYEHLERMSLRFFTHTKVGELMSRLNNDVIGAQNAISNTIISILTNIVQAVAVLAVMFTLEWRLTLISIVILPLFLLAASRMATRLRDIARENMSANAQMNAMMNETLNIGGVLLVKLFGRVEEETRRFEARAKAVKDIGVRRAVTGASFFVIIGLLSAVGSALVYGIGGYLVMQNAFTVGTIVAFGAYLGSLYSALQSLANAPVEFATSVVSFERVFEVLDLPLEIAEKPDPVRLKEIRGELVFENVTFRYAADESNLLSDVRRFGQMDQITAALSGEVPEEEEEEEPEAEVAASQARSLALEDISFTVQPGELVALVGPSGAGKTTLTYLIPRLYDPDEGRICLDGYDLRDLSLDDLARQVGMVTQETHLFHDTVRTNLLYARPDATQEEIEEAARAANIHDFIAGLPHGYNTVVGERGYRLSGGEKQRLAIARVILKNPRVLVFDEATSSLDSQSEALIQEALKRVMQGRTTIVIAHRLSTILAADQILVMNRGRIVERGTHDELLQLDGLYAHLYHTQFSREPGL